MTQKSDMEIIIKIMPKNQLKTVKRFLRGEEKSYFKEVIKDLAKTFNTMPKTYEQDGKGNDAKIYLHYFYGNTDYYITEKDKLENQCQAFGLVSNEYGFELGYIDITAIINHPMLELDFHWKVKTIKEVKNKA